MKKERKDAANKGVKAPGDTEHEFLVPFPSSVTTTLGIAVASNEKIYVADVESGENGGIVFVASTTRSGEVDPGFGLGGWATQYVEIAYARVLGLLLRDDGGVVVAVKRSVNDKLDVALVCFTENGELDPTFGEGGMIVHRIPLPESPRASAPSEEASEVADGGQTLGYGSVVAAAEDGSFYGLLGFREGPFYALIRFHADGRLDTSFNGTGFVTDGAWFGKRWGASSIVVAADGRVTVVGLLYDIEAIPVRRLAVWRFTPDGSIDRSFGDEGYAFFDADAADVDPQNLYQTHFSHAASLPDDGVVICGYLMTRSGNLFQRFGMLACLDASGKPLEAFNRGKFLLYGVLGDYQTDFDGGLGVQGDGMFVVGGRVSNSPVTDGELLVARFQPSGMLDSTFANGGARRFKPDDTRVNYMWSLLIDSNGKILVAAAGGPDNNASSMRPFVFQLSGR